MTATYRPEFEAALRLFARVSEAMVARGLARPVLVGGAAAEYYSMSALATGDFDVTTPSQPELEEELQRAGFVRPSGPGKLTRGWAHPELALGFEVVADVPMDGSVDTARMRLFEVTGGTDVFRIIPVEDLIADRMGQYASGTARDRIDQARVLLLLNSDADMEYLERRIREESFGDYGIEDIQP
ncbi:MAG: hypothetical protein ABI898_04755 [Sphingomonadales bacterium]